MDFIKKQLEDKKTWRLQMKRVKALPEDYRIVYKEIQNYLFSFSAGSGMDTVHGIYDLIDFLEEGAASDIPVLDYIGEDVGEFAENYRRSIQTQSWLDDAKKKASKNVEKSLKKDGK